MVENKYDKAKYLETAFAIGCKLARTAIWDGDRCNWLGSAVEPVNGVFAIVDKTFDSDVYNGTSGIALFLSKLLKYKPDDIIKETFHGAVNQILSSSDYLESAPNYAYFGGKFGVAITMIDLGQLHQKDLWSKFGWDLLQNICKADIQDHEVDIISGVAGTLPSLIKLYKETNDVVLAEAINKISTFIFDKANKTENSWSWTAVESQPPMTGYSHGASGVATSLLELFQLTKNANFYNAAKMGYNFENLNFNQQAQNWPDLRNMESYGMTSSSMPQCGEAWCHGGPGIGISRLRAWEITKEEQYKQEAIIGLNASHRNIYNALTNQSVPSNFSLCHGLAGNADILLEGGKMLNNETYIQVAYDVGNYGIERFHKTKINWPSGVNDPHGGASGNQETPGLLLGLAGTGYFYLRLAFPEEIPSLLILKSE